MPRNPSPKGKKSTSPAQTTFLEPAAKTAPCVPAIRRVVDEWRVKDYAGVSDTTRILLNFWFKTDHRLSNGHKFAYHKSQQEAIETLIYLYEVAGVRRHKMLVENYAGSNKDLRLLQYDDFARYCIKMATGSGKTKVMALAIAWQYFNSVAEAREDFARTFLLFAPNVIVFERLRHDFASGRIFRTDPIIPEELKTYWDFDCYMRGDAERAQSLGALYLTNIQQFYERADRSNDDEPDVMTAVLGSKPPAQKLEIEDFDKRIISRGGAAMVINDEAHHTHDEESEWNKVIRKLNDSRSEGQLCAQLDFTATPRYSKGALFTWTVFDYPLKQAIEDGIVKRPIKGITRGTLEAKSTITSTRYKAYLTAGVERWKEYFEQLKPLKKKPILFVMMNDTNEADDVGDYLQKKYPSEFGGNKLLVIHTDTKGEITKKDLDKARKAAREVDDLASPVNAIVSVLMLREGWDVQNVTVVVGLRPYTSKANILPEQTIGRGLRLMFRELSSDYTERVDVIGNKAFIEFVEDLEREEEIAFGTFEVGKDKLVINTVMPDPEKLDKDILLPSLSPVLARKKTLAEEIESLDVTSFDAPTLPYKSSDEAAKTFQYEGYDLLTLQKMVERTYTLPEISTSQEAVSYYAKRIAQEVKLPSQFAALVPKVQEFLSQRAFGKLVDLDNPTVIKAINSNIAQYVTVQTFVKALRPLVVEEMEPQLLSEGRRLSETPPFPHSRQTLPARNTIFNMVAVGNEFELNFAKFLEKAPDVDRFAKLPDLFGFAIEYTDSNNNLRYYEPDFVAVTIEGTHYLVETKGREDVDVANKDRAAILWCENATRLTGTNWQYVKVPQKEYEKLEPNEFMDLSVFAQGMML
ncbi:MAG: Type III restriction-modification enzyme helicase subunit [Anaerolineaceae bacterium]|nr:MAG: Type III restriction-modification enzyme helicase subunit [Anaerolineaceae bacterium]